MQEDTTAPTLKLTSPVQANKLLDFCLEYIFEHITRIEVTDAYVMMGKSQPRLMVRFRWFYSLKGSFKAIR